MTDRPYNFIIRNPLPVSAPSGGLLTQDYLAEVAKGNVSGHSLVHKYGRNSALANGSFEFVVGLGHTSWPLSAATTVRVKAGGDAADDTAGAGAREVTVQGIDSAFAETSEAIATAGASASSATTASFWRVHRAWVSSVGTYGAANTGAVTIENSAGGTDLIQIAADEGQSQFCGWSVPLGKTAYLLAVDMTVDGNKSADFALYSRADLDDTSAPMASKRLRRYWDGVSGSVSYRPRSPELVLSAKSDVWVEGMGNGAGVEATATFELLVVDD